MDSLEKQSPINRDELDESAYFQSLAMAMYSKGLLGDREMEQLQMQGLQILSNLTEQYTHGQSGSVRTEVAQGMLTSVFYTIGIFLESCPDLDGSVSAMLEKPLALQFEEGQKLIARQINCGKTLLLAVKKSRLATQNLAYCDTIDNGLAPFFAEYEPRFSAHETPGMIDYPLCIDEMKRTGISYINDYLQKLLWENQFCRNFSALTINSVMRGYDKHYEHLLINFFERILTNAIGCVVCGKSPFRLLLNGEDRELLQKKLEHLPERERAAQFQKAAQIIFAQLDTDSIGLQEYMDITAKNIAAELTRPLKHQLLAQVFVGE